MLAFESNQLLSARSTELSKRLTLDSDCGRQARNERRVAAPADGSLQGRIPVHIDTVFCQRSPLFGRAVKCPATHMRTVAFFATELI